MLYEDGYHWESLRLASIYTDKGCRIKVIGTSIDVDIQKRAELEYAEQLKYISEIADENILEKALINISQNKIEFIWNRNNQPILDVERLSYEECIRRYSLGAKDEKERRKLQNAFGKQILLDNFQKGENFTSLRYRRQSKDRNSIIVSANCRVFAKPDTGDYMCFVYARDITAKVMEENIMQRITNVEYDFLAIINVENGTLFAHNTSEAMKNKIPAKYRDYDRDRNYIFRKVLDPQEVESVIEKTSLPYIKEKLAHQENYFFTVKMREQGSSYQRKKLQYCYLDESHSDILFSKSDVTKIYEQEQRQLKKVEQALETAEQAVLAKTEFMSRMSHDIRTPMNGIIGMTQLALEEEMSEEVRSCLMKIENASEFLLSLINDILDLAKIESGKIELKRELVNGSEFIQSVEDIIRPIAENKGIELICDFTGRRMHWVRMDRMRCQQILLNLLNNAVKFSESGSSIQWSLLEEKVDDSHFRVINRIIDHGCGMSSEFLPSIFQPFQQENNTCNNRHAGTGLGLAIVKNLVDQMNGTIEVESTLGEGSSFKVTVLMEIGEEEQLREEKESSRQENVEQLAGKHILLCEDHPLNTEIARRMLEKRQMEVVCAENGQVAITEFQKSEVGYFDAILMDIRMPVMDGIEATKQIRMLQRKDARSIPIIAMTANAFEEDRKNTREAGMNAHLAKPVSPKLLFDTLLEFL